MLLKRLIQVLDTHLHNAILALDAAGIKTTESLIFTPPKVILQHTSTIPTWILEELIDECVRHTAPLGRTGEDELEAEEIRPMAAAGGGPAFTGFGVGKLDEIWGMWDGRGVVEICGPQKVGKSLLMLHLVLRSLVDAPSDTAKWLDTVGSFTAARAQEILHRFGIQDASKVLERLQVLPCYDGNHVLEIIEKIREEPPHADTGGTRILVIDSIAPLLKDTIVGSGSQGHASMMALLKELSEVAYEHNLTILVSNNTASSRPTNPASSFIATDVKPALGIDFTYFADITLLVQSTGKIFGEIDEGERDREWGKPGLRGVVEVIKSRISSTGKWGVFETLINTGRNQLDGRDPPSD